MVTTEELQKKIDESPRVKLANLPTPLEKMPRLTKLLDGPQLWIKREDCTGLALGGNKERKAEFTIGDALNKKADTVITVGSIQSNHARSTVAAAVKKGLKVSLVLTGEKPKNPDGNLLMIHLLGAEIKNLRGKPTKFTIKNTMEEIAANLRKKGHTPYIIPSGASYPPGAIAYVNMMLELLTQAQENNIKISHIFHAAGSGGTQAGLVLANKALGSEVKIIGICAEPNIRDQLIAKTVEIANKTSKLLDLKTIVMSSDIVLNDDYAGEEYERMTPAALKAIKLVAKTEGILLDPIYTGRAMAGLIDLIKSKSYRKGDNIVFLHTGGSPTLFPFKKEFATHT